MTLWNIIRPYLFTWIVVQVLGIILVLLCGSVYALILPESAFVPFYVMAYLDTHSKCPICGKRHLLRQARVGGSRYTLYNAFCPIHKRWIEVQRDWSEGKTTYFRPKGNLNYERITPVWDKN